MVQRNVAGQKITIKAINTTTGAPVTGDAANMTAYGGKDGNVGGFASLNASSVTEWASGKLSTGAYLITPSQTETDGNELFFFILSTTPNVLAWEAFATVPPNFTTMLNPLGQVTVGNNLDKAGYSLSASGITAIWAATMEGAFTAVQYMRLFAGVLLSKASGLPTAPKYRDTADTKDRVVAVTDTDGNRTSVTLDGT